MATCEHWFAYVRTFYGLPTGASQGVDGSCNYALETIRYIRQRLGSTSEGTSEVVAEQKANFAPYKQSKCTAGGKGQTWTVKKRLPCSVAERETLVRQV